jgi:tetratricopeptide (TPR) repeat protein
VIYQFIFGSSSRFFSGIVSPAGTFNDFAIFLGALEIVSLSVLYFYREKKFLRVLGYAGVLVPLPFLIAVDFRLLWYGLTLTLGIWMLVVTSDIAHVLCMFNERRSRLSAYLIALTRIPRTSVVLFALALTLSFGGGSVLFGNTSLVSSMRKLTHIAPVAEVRLSTSGTFMIAHHILSESPFFGAGPNRFADTFLRFKDAALNTTPVWDKVYDQGFGFFPTLLVTAGLLFAAALLYLVFAFVTASRYLRRVLSSDRSISFPVVTLYTLAAFFLLFLVFSTPGASVLGLAFILMGAFVGSLGAAGLIGGLQMGILGRDQRRIVDGIAIVKFLGLVFLAFILTREALAFIHYRAGQLAAVDGDLVTARAELYTAQGIFPTDTYVRDISVLALLDLDKTKRVASASKDEVTKHAFDLIHIAKLSSEEAVRLNPAKAKNYVQQGATFEALASLGVTSAYTPAREAYAAALLRDPTSPDVMYYAGRTALAAGDRKSAVEWFTKVLAIRPNHKSTLAALIPILESNGNTEGVRSVLIRAVEFDANNADSRFALGLFYYKEHAFSEAAKQFAAALRSDAQYADARFYLAGSAYELGEKDFALQQLRIVQQSNPRHELLNQFISAIEQGNDPFAEDIYGTQNN